MKYCFPAGADWSCYGTPAEIEALDPVIKERSESLAWMAFSGLTGYRVATCPVDLRPCQQGCNPGSYIAAPVIGGGSGGNGYLPFAGIAPFTPVLSGGSWYNITCGCGTDDCSCTGVSEIRLPSNSGGIASVKIGVDVIPTTSYRIDNGSRLVRTDGEQWPLCQDMSAAPGTDGAFVVSYYEGAIPSDMDFFAVGLLAAEFYRACTDDRKCRLPRGVTSVVRQGISYEVKSDMFADGVTGIAEVDVVIRHHNPNLLKGRPRVLSPDRRRGRVTTARF